MAWLALLALEAPLLIGGGLWLWATWKAMA